MKAELVKRQDRWDLYGEDGSKIASSAPNPFKRLSIKNCQAIENGYDLDELAENTYREYPTDLKDATYHYNRDYQVHKKRKAFIKGFKKALEILGDKKFSEEDVISMIEKSRETGLTADYLISTKQQTEWDCIIFVDEKTNQPLLDNEGNLILKRK